MGKIPDLSRSAKVEAEGGAAALAAPIHVIINPKSGTNANDAAAIDRAVDVLGRDRTHLQHWKPGEDPAKVVRRCIDAGARTIVAAGGDGTAVAIAGAMLGQDCAMAVLPLGTFNFFSRGLGLAEEPEKAARALLDSEPRKIRIGTVNGKVFLNNASLGLYPAILKERESVYARWGRHRIIAHWSVLRTFLRFQRPMHMKITADGTVRERRSPLLFVARSAYQLDYFGLGGERAIHDDAFAVLVACDTNRWGLIRLAWRLVTRRMREGRDYELIEARELDVETRRRRALVAFDGEKVRDRSPFGFRIADEALTIMVPRRDEGRA